MEDSVFKNLTIAEAKKLINQIKDNKEYNVFVKELDYFVNLQGEKITNEILDELQNLMARIKKLLELDNKIKEKENMVKLFEENSSYFKEQEIRKEDVKKLANGELFKIIEEIDSIGGKIEIDHDLIFITRYGAENYKKLHKKEYKGELTFKVFDNKDELLEKILRVIENNY